MADPWHAEYYAELRRGKHDRATTTMGHIKRIATFTDDLGPVLESMVVPR